MTRRRFLELMALGPMGLFLLAAKPPLKPNPHKAAFQATAFTVAFQ